MTAIRAEGSYPGEHRDGPAAWLAWYGERADLSHEPATRDSQRAAHGGALCSGGGPQLRLAGAPADCLPGLAEAPGCRAIFGGVLYDRAELASCLAARLPRDASDAELVGQAYLAWGEDALARLRGAFALVIWDRRKNQVLCARDPLGMHPLFYAETAGALLLSPSIDTLLRQPGVSSELNRAGMVDALARRWIAREETYFTNVRRVLPAHALWFGPGGRRMRRYWDPAPRDRDIAWIPDEEVQPRFDALLDQAVGRRLALGPAGIFLSGGLDSATIAARAADICRRDGRQPPLALSIDFPDPYSERTVQRGVAAALGMPQVQIPFGEAAGADGIFAAGLELSRSLPAPLFNPWAPAYVRLMRDARHQGCRVILTGEGGDEWLGVSPHIAADLIRSMDLVGAYRLWRSHARWYPSVRWGTVHGMLWDFVLRPKLRNAWRGTAAVLHRLSRRHPRLGPGGAANAMLRVAPEPWIAPDSALRAQVAHRLEESWRAATPPGGAPSAYLQDLWARLDSPRPWLSLEENFILGRRNGVSIHDPLWDVDLVDLLVGVRPQVRSRDGVSKALVRSGLGARFPGLGFETQSKSALGTLIQSLTAAEAGKAARALGGRWALAELGIVDSRRAAEFLEHPAPEKSWRVWDIVNLEVWARAHCGAGR
jgi:asparagine synthase (glutamine-hydrolysing)